LKLENIMRDVVKSLRMKPESGRLDSKIEQYTTGLTREIAGSHVPVSDEVVVGTALELLARLITKGPLLSNPTAVKDYLRLRFADLQHEVFYLMLLDKRHRLIACEEMFRGTIDGASVHPREVVKTALRHNSAAVILAHNHPSSCAEPSHADELITHRLKSALELVDIRVIDHILGGFSCVITASKAHEIRQFCRTIRVQPPKK
jgi:DNA repair protein RadC